MAQVFGNPRSLGMSFSQQDKNLAFAVQAVFEETVAFLAMRARQLTGSLNVALAGGCALNCKSNGKLARLIGPSQLWVQPVSSDAGCALGAALIVAHGLGENVIRSFPLDSVYWGPEFSDDQIRQALDEAGFKYSLERDIAAKTAESLLDGTVVGWFQGRMEAGPRALGGRSILADPTSSVSHARVTDVKRREAWRPFCPSLTAEEGSRLLVDDYDSPFMIVSALAKAAATQELPSVVHIDDSTRPQYVTEARNPVFYQLLNKMGELNGHQAVLNTSFNVQGEPIVCSPGDALRSFQNSDLDALAIGNYWVHR